MEVGINSEVYTHMYMSEFIFLDKNKYYSCINLSSSFANTSGGNSFFSILDIFIFYF